MCAPAGSTRRLHRVSAGGVVAALVASAAIGITSDVAGAASPRIDLQVLVLDDGTPWVQAIAGQLALEGVPTVHVDLSDASRPPITATTLASTDHAYFQAVVAPSAAAPQLSADEWAAVHAFEAAYSIREVDGFNWPGQSLGLATAVHAGDIAGSTATVTAAAKSSGFGSLAGPVPFAVGSYSFLATPLTSTTTPALPAGATFTPFVTVPAPTGEITSIVGVYASDGLERMVITAAFASSFPQFRMLAHGMVTWMTRGVHLGLQRNYLTFHVDDAFVEDALWDVDHNCTPGEDCPLGADGQSLYPESSIRMTPDDVNYAVQWEAANQYTLTLAFNGIGIVPGDPLTVALQANRAAFKWLNHGLEHIYQGCVQDFTVVPWTCATNTDGTVAWTPQATIQSEITANITAGQSIGLNFDTREYLSGEHSGLAQPPQQLVDNPNFAAAITALGIRTIGADASREPGARVVGGATTVPRHPTALYYNTATATAAVDEYNWLYTSRANGGSGYCEDNPATATCIAPLDQATGFGSYIVPTDAAFDLGFVLSNDPRPFYAHVSNLSGDRLLYPLLGSILTQYRAAFATNTPVVNLTLTQAATALRRQRAWAGAIATATPAVTASVQGGVVTIVNPTGVEVPLTVPAGTSVLGASLETYAGERSAWLAGSVTTATLPTTPLSVRGSTSLVEGRLASISVTTASNASLDLAGSLPTGLTWTTGSPGTATIAGTPAAGTVGSYPLTISSTGPAGVASTSLTIVVNRRPVITAATTATVVTGQPFSTSISVDGVPTPSLAVTGQLPPGLSVAVAGTSATISGVGTATASQSYRMTITATNAAGSVSQSLTLRTAVLPVFTSTTSRTVTARISTSFSVTTTASPRAALTALDALPAGLTFRDRGDGTAAIFGTPSSTAVGTKLVRIRATNTAGSVIQVLSITVRS